MTVRVLCGVVYPKLPDVEFGSSETNNAETLRQQPGHVQGEDGGIRLLFRKVYMEIWVDGMKDDEVKLTSRCTNNDDSEALYRLATSTLLVSFCISRDELTLIVALVGEPGVAVSPDTNSLFNEAFSSLRRESSCFSSVSLDIVVEF